MNCPPEYRNRLYQGYVSTGQSGRLGISVEASFESRRPSLQRIVARHVSKDLALRICDLGCGSGMLLRELHYQGYTRLKGVEVSREMYDLAAKQGLTCICLGDIFEFLAQSPPSSYDLVFLMDVLEHLTLPEQFQLLDQVKRILAPAGRLVLHVPNAAGWWGMAVRYGDITHETCFTPSSIRQLLRATGFGSIRCFEDVPVAHGVVSLFRLIIWHLLTIVPRLVYAAETGSRDQIMSQNMTVSAVAL